MRQRISRNIRWARFLFAVFSLGLIIILINTMKDDFVDMESIITEIIILLVFIALYFLFDAAKTVEFDEDFMFVTGKEREEIVPLKNINKIKLTMIQINKHYMWKIGYINELSKEKSVRILPKYRQFEEFKNIVRIANENIKIKNWSHSFDFDQ